MTRRALARLLPLAAILLLFHAASCKRKESATPTRATPAAGTPRLIRSFAPVPTRTPIKVLPGQPTPLPELPG